VSATSTFWRLLLNCASESFAESRCSHPWLAATCQHSSMMLWKRTHDVAGLVRGLNLIGEIVDAIVLFPGQSASC